MKKLLLSLGALSAVVAPVAAVVACGSTDSKDPVAPAATKPSSTNATTTNEQSSLIEADLAKVKASDVTDLASAKVKLGVELNGVISGVDVSYDDTTRILTLSSNIMGHKVDNLYKIVAKEASKTSPAVTTGVKTMEIETHISTKTLDNQASMDAKLSGIKYNPANKNAAGIKLLLILQSDLKDPAFNDFDDISYDATTHTVTTTKGTSSKSFVLTTKDTYNF